MGRATGRTYTFKCYTCGEKFKEFAWSSTMRTLLNGKELTPQVEDVKCKCGGDADPAERFDPIRHKEAPFTWWENSKGQVRLKIDPNESMPANYKAEGFVNKSASNIRELQEFRERTGITVEAEGWRRKSPEKKPDGYRY